ncbi:MAG: UDP-3-O-(3-hydroxymyristoyl)glucosamine N-acyltransferase [Bacteroidetes bacterium]|nr:UDP-3-O-(3-hydroxymyristoyl)glucosamine N-acyltransferase [Bacteroidota bacterium]
MKFNASQIAMMLQGTLEGNDVAVGTLSKIEEGKEGSLSFLSNPKYQPFIYTTQASVVIVNEDFHPEQQLPAGLSLIRVKDAYGAFAQLLQAYNQFLLPVPGISQYSSIDPSAEIGANVHIGDWVSVGAGAQVADGAILQSGVVIGARAKIGKSTVLFPGVKVYHECVIGEACTIHANAVIGSDGFGFAPNADNQYSKIPQIGNVIIEDHVDVGANTTIDRATMGSTIIRKGVKLDNLIQIGHNVEIGENTVIAAQTGVAGSTKIGKNCMIGGQVGFAGHIHIVDGTKIAAQSGVAGSIKTEGATLMGTPAISIMDFNKSYIFFKKLPALQKTVDALKAWMDSQAK